MGVSQKSKRITWAPDVNLCQVRLFSSAEPPSEVGMGIRDRLQTKVSWPDESLPPGFEDFKPANLKFPQIPMTKWRCPPRYEVNSEWQLVSGEESKEIESQKQRERRVLEEIYPRPSAIPPNPRAPVNAQESVVRNQNIPLIPLTPIEDTNAGVASALPQPADSSRRMTRQPQNGGNIAQLNGMSMQPDTIAAALASVLSNIPNIDQRNLIDQNLLIRVLTNPKLVEQLLAHTVSSTQHIPNLESQPKISSESTSIRISRDASLSAQNTKPQVNAASMTTTAPPQLTTGLVSTSRPAVDNKSSAQSPGVVKNLNYYKSLIQQHGVVVPPQSCGQSNRMMGASREYSKSRDEMKAKIMKPCIYFNSLKGCKFGANCNYIHGTFSSRKRAGCVTEVVAAKRVKLGSSMAL